MPPLIEPGEPERRERAARHDQQRGVQRDLPAAMRAGQRVTGGVGQVAAQRAGGLFQERHGEILGTLAGRTRRRVQSGQNIVPGSALSA
ncbi:hypothetical protein DM50_3711 [Burkholderia mallei]|nr:hypothetical protein DM50_3711 [Burkholderia mallei]